MATAYILRHSYPISRTALMRTLSDSLIQHLQHQNNKNINHNHGTFHQHRARIATLRSKSTHNHLILTNSNSPPIPTDVATPPPPQLQAERQQRQRRSHRSLRWHRRTIRRRCRAHRLRKCEGGRLWWTGGAVRGGNLHGTWGTIRVKERFVRFHPFLPFSALFQSLLSISHHS